MSSRYPAPSRKKIVEANPLLLARLGMCQCVAESTCWACGIDRDNPIRAHVVAHTYGGSDTDPQNFFLLCDVCHDSQPDGLPREAQEEWLLSAPSSVDWGMAIVRQLIGHLEQAGSKNGDPDAWQRFAQAPGANESMRAAIAGGYARAAGTRNGKANAMWSARKMLESWLTTEGEAST